MPIGTTNSKRNMICDFCCLSVITSAYLYDVYSDLIFRHFKYTRWSHQFSRFLFWKQYSLSTRLIYCCSKSASQVHTVRNYLPILRSNVITSNCVQTSRHWPPNHYVTKSNYAFAIALEALAESWHLHATLPPSLRYAHCNNIELRCVIQVFQDLYLRVAYLHPMVYS